MGEINESIFASRLDDILRISEKRPAFLGFLDEYEAVFAEDFLKRRKSANYLFWGGFPEAKRCFLGVFPDFFAPDVNDFPITAVTFSFKKEYALTHRDFLGSFMALGIERNVIGDILVGEGKAVSFLKREFESYFLQNCSKVGRTGVRIESGIIGELPFKQEFEDMSGVIASNRIDCFVAFLNKSSREAASLLISEGMIFLNGREVRSNSASVSPGDVISVRGRGKFIVDSFGSLTKKNRLPISCRKYK